MTHRSTAWRRWKCPNRALAALLAWSVCYAAAPASGADLSKTLHVLIKKSETGLDPATASDVNTLAVIDNIFDPLLRYDYLARPVRLQPNTVVAMPEIDHAGTTYTFHLRHGIYFTPDPAFQGHPRELTAADYVYSFQRLYDPRVKSPWRFVFDGKIAGDDAFKRASPAPNAGEVQIAGLSAPDKYTLRIRLRRPDNNFLLTLAMPATAAVAREVIDAAPRDPGGHPIGTGPYFLRDWVHGDSMLLQANPSFRETVFQAPTQIDSQDRPIAATLNGKRLPLVGRIEIKVIEEQQAAILGFLSGQFDFIEQIPPPLAGMVLQDGRLRPELARQGIQLAQSTALQTCYMWMNMDDPVLGGYAPERIALRRAIALSYDRDEDIRVLEHGLALPAQSPLPPNVQGYDPAYRSSARYDPQLARALLERYGYRASGGDGYRSLPDGKPLTLTMDSQASTTGRLRDELWRRSLNAIGIRVVFKSDKYTEIIKASRQGEVQMFETDWIADIPDGENFYQLLYGPNRGGVNYARFDLPEFNRLFEQTRQQPDSPQRTGLYRQMNRLIEGYAPWVIRIHPQLVDLYQPWLKNYKRHPVELSNWRYLDVERSTQH
jgi:ABC-type transport system substrate-binding protein